MREAEQLASAGRIGEAILLLEDAIAKGHESPGIAKSLARLSLRIDEVRAFQSWCHEALRMDPRDAEVHDMLADYFFANGRECEGRDERALADALR